MTKRIILFFIAFSLILPLAWEDDVWNQSLQKIESIVSLIEQNYYQEVDREELTHSTIRGMLQTLDPHSYFLNPKNLTTLREEYKGKYFGLGLMIQKQEDRLVVVTPLEGTPAYRLGIQAGDIISHIEGESTKPISSFDAMQKLRGPEGTDVAITIVREGLDEPLEFTITRAEIPLYSVPYAFILKEGIGYIYIRNFAETTTEEFREKMKILKAQGMDKLLLDLRWDGGGTFPQSIELSDEFLPKGALVVSIKGRKSYYNRKFYALHDDQYEEIPLIILINNATASAPEIVSGAVMDNDRGLIVGDDSFGKGLVQTLFPLASDAAIALTTAKYFTPSGRSIQRDYSEVDDYYFAREAPNEESREVRYTVNGRKVLGQGGITPDYKVEFTYALLTVRLLSKGAFFEYAKKFTARKTPLSKKFIFPVENGEHAQESNLTALDKNFTAAPAVLDDFKSFIRGIDIPFDEAEFDEAKDQLKREIEREIFTFIWGIEEGTKVFRQSDPVVRRAIELFPEALALLQKGLK
ncbi:MAG: S41 family peptidase [Candidatus Aminicenantes bacterium]|nr:S41 family peptidase [Candidatus Aminicenantes bacterium]